ncbi:unnamed protein product [Mytilus coruscus]|uniref:MACPF domain-containing protein n=1 Tax=Mytilus coruscus TaxID=42192 RepID=A0A6J8EU54_MYTCO|nr:unnamed protein product [Mytilus coruscus]
MNRRSYEEDLSENETKKTKSREKQLLFMVPKILFVLVFIGIAYLAVSTSLRMQGKRGVDLNHNGKREEVATENPRNNGLIENLLSRTKLFKVDVGMRSDYRLQDCGGTHFKRTFPDIDYAFFGYNILKGYPLANGHDPGFTYPIFETDYTERRESSDCRYRIPRGLVVVPDVSCITSFSSTTVQNKYELTKSLSQSAKVSVGVGIVAFSASAGYKESSSELSTGEFVKIISTAKCTYYFCKLDKVSHPYFTKSFISSVKKLDESTQDQIYLDFFHYYEKHFLNYTEFGARFTYEHTMDSKTFQKKEEAGHNVGVDASYSGEYKIGGGFNMDSTHKQDASNFAKDVTTKTFTVGAPPPANGDAMTWVSTVKQSPVPMSYKLSPISELFTEKYI